MSTLLPPAPTSDTPILITENEFLESVPPGQQRFIGSMNISLNGVANSWLTWEPKDLRLYCKSEECSGFRFFEPLDSHGVQKKGISRLYAVYCCRNCKKEYKAFALLIERSSDELIKIYKYGELPQFGPPNPPKVMALMGGERDAYLKGRRCENQGLGIAAFAYYRRVVENQKAKIIGEILKVAEKLNADPELIEDLKAAKLETRFTEAIGRIKHGLPPVLLIDGHNPLTLLHSALSEGLHGNSDEDCLELATSIRVVLTELVERMATAVKEEAVLTSAVQRLLKANAKR